MPELKNKNSSHIGSKIPQKLKTAVEKTVINGDYLNLSEFVRDAVKEKLAQEGLVGGTITGAGG
jgi:Arc/MetJ-type ribon-helix-helix transcriptional regulator